MCDKQSTQSGYITLDRQILKWGWYHRVNVTRVFIHLLLIANWEDDNFELATIKRGECVRSLETLAREVSLSIRQVRDAINVMIKTHELSRRVSHGINIITILNYDKYQTKQKEKSHEICHNDRDSLVTGKSQVSHEKVTDKSLSKEEKEKKEEKERKKEVVNKKDFTLEDAFNDARIAYKGTKRGHETEFKNFKAKNKDWREQCLVIKKAVLWAVDCNFYKDYWSNFQTFINNRKWEEVEENILDMEDFG